MEHIISINSQRNIELFDFYVIDEMSDLMESHISSDDHRKVIAKDVEMNLYYQAPGVQLLSISCKEVKVIQTVSPSYIVKENRTVKRSILKLTLGLEIMTADRAIWSLDVCHDYELINIQHNENQKNISQNFAVTGHRRVSAAR